MTPERARAEVARVNTILRAIYKADDEDRASTADLLKAKRLEEEAGYYAAIAGDFSPKSTLFKEIRKCVKREGVSATARKLGMKRQHLSGILNQSRGCSLDMMLAILSSCGMTLQTAWINPGETQGGAGLFEPSSLVCPAPTIREAERRKS